MAKSIFQYTAFNLDGSVAADSNTHPITKANPTPLRGFRFAHLQVHGQVCKDRIARLQTFLESTQGCLMVGNKPISERKPRVVLYDDPVFPYLFDFAITVSRPKDMVAICTMIVALLDA